MSRSVQPGASAPVAAVAWRRPAFTLLALALGIAAVLVGRVGRRAPPRAAGGSAGRIVILRPVARDRLTRFRAARRAAAGRDGRPPRLGGRTDDAGLAGAADLARGPGLLARRRRASPWRCCWAATWPARLPAAGRCGWREATALFLLPFLFTSLFLLSSAHLLADIGRAVGIGRWFGWYGEATFGRIVLLFLFNELDDRRRRLADRRPLDPQLAPARACSCSAPFAPA